MSDVAHETLDRDLAYLCSIRACGEAFAYVKSVGSLERAWRECDRHDWIIWLAARVVDRRTLVGIASACARLALPIWTARYPEDSRVTDCLDACDRYARGEDVNLVPYRQAAYAAYAAAAAAAAYAAAAAAAADAAAAAAAAAADAAYAAAAAAADAAYAAADAGHRDSGRWGVSYEPISYAAADAAYAARRSVRAQCCGIVRERVTWDRVAAAMEGQKA